MKQKFLYAVCGAVVAVALVGCSGINALLKSGQPELIYSKALEYYKIGKWQRASTLFEGVQPYYTGTSREDSISFYNAHCKFKNRDYDAASTLLDEFRRKFGRSVFIEDAEGMYALCYYYLAPGPTRDQTMTGQAIMAINEFIARYPQSDQIENFRKINEELNGRLHEKAYLNAYTYYKIGRYKSAIVALKNALKQYPDTEHREEMMYLIVDSGYRLASNSVIEKQTDRYLDMLDSYLSFREEFPESKYLKELDRMAQHARRVLFLQIQRRGVFLFPGTFRRHIGAEPFLMRMNIWQGSVHLQDVSSAARQGKRSDLERRRSLWYAAILDRITVVSLRACVLERGNIAFHFCEEKYGGFCAFALPHGIQPA